MGTTYEERMQQIRVAQESLEAKVQPEAQTHLTGEDKEPYYRHPQNVKQYIELVRRHGSKKDQLKTDQQLADEWPDVKSRLDALEK